MHPSMYELLFHDTTRQDIDHDLRKHIKRRIISACPVRGSILSHRLRVNSSSTVDDSILFDGVDVGRHCRIRRAIIDKDVKIPQGSTIGYDLEHDRQRGFTITESGIVVIAKAELSEAFV